jgi:hypothetical protein
MQMRRRQAAAGPVHADIFDRWARLLDVVKWPVIVAAIVVLLASARGIGYLRTSVGLDELLSPKSRVMRDYRWLEERIGPLIPVEIMLVMPSSDEKGLLKQFSTVERVHRALQEEGSEYVVMSAATFAPKPPPKRGGIRQIAQAAAFRKKLVGSTDALHELGYLRESPDESHWRITVRTPSGDRKDYCSLLDRLRKTTVSATQGHGAVAPREVVVCGGVPLIFQTQEQLLSDLIRSFLLAFALVGLVLMLLFRSVLCGAICMIPNLLPTLAVFGLLGWLGRPVEVGSVLTASAALGVAVDDSLHLITWFRRKVAAGSPVNVAVAYAFRRCSLAMVQTTLICGCGLAVFALSPFNPIARFGCFMFALLLLALVADLIVLPAILLSPLGIPFLPASGADVEPACPLGDEGSDDRNDEQYATS